MSQITKGLYLGDNGMCLCAEHLGYTAKATGRDISGQKIMRVTPRMLADEGMVSVACEIPSCDASVNASVIWTPSV